MTMTEFQHPSQTQPLQGQRQLLCECSQCGALQQLPRPVQPLVMQCWRCRHALQQIQPGWVPRCLALTLAGLVLFIISNSFPFLTLQLGALSQQVGMLSGVAMLWQDGQWLLALLVFGTIFLFPLLELLCLGYVLLPMLVSMPVPARIGGLKLMQWMRRWNMLEVFLLGVLVSAVKLDDMAQVEAGLALYSFFAMVVVIAAAQRQLNTQDLWAHINPCNYFSLSKEPLSRAQPEPHHLEPGDSAIGAAVACACCGALVSEDLYRRLPQCPRCAGPLSQRIPFSMQKTLALLLAAAVLYIPANLLPMMISQGVGTLRRDTIVSGVIHLAQDAWPLALVVFVASVLVPISKILILSYLWWSVYYRQGNRTIHQRMRLYRLTQFIGHWSMVDVYVVMLMVSLVQFGMLANITVGPAALAFGGVVILTMMAADNFDSRLMWDVLESDEQQPATA